MIKVVWTDPATQDLANIHTYISEDSSVYADALFFEIFHNPRAKYGRGRR